jgi:hypothetical protein
MPVNSPLINEAQTIETRRNNHEPIFGKKKKYQYQFKKMIHGRIRDVPVGLSSMKEMSVAIFSFILRIYLKVSLDLFNLLNSCKHPVQVSRSISHSTNETKSFRIWAWINGNP